MRSPWSSPPAHVSGVSDVVAPVAPAAVPDRVAGYRAVRRLGSGSCCDVYLGRSECGDTVALKVFGADAPAARVEREVRALSAGRAGTVPGLPTLIDVASLTDGGTCLVLERLEGESLARYLQGCATLLLPGEAVTILAPILATLSGLHEGGFVHTELSLATVLVDLSGRPVLLGLGALHDLPQPGPERVPLLRADYARVERLVRGTLEALDPSVPTARQAEHVRARCTAAAAASPFRPCLPQLEGVLFDWAGAVSLHRSSGPTAPADPQTKVDAVRAGGTEADRGVIRRATTGRSLTRRAVRQISVARAAVRARLWPVPARQHASRHPS